MDNNNANNDIKKGVNFAQKITSTAMKFIAGGVTVPFFFLATLIIIIATCLTLVLSVFFGGEPNKEAIENHEFAQTEITNACQADVDQTIKWMRDLYMDKSEDATMATREYIVKVLGEDAVANMPDPDAGFLASLKDFFGINKGGTDATLKDWKYHDYDKSNRINMHFNKSYQEVGQSLYGYINATISAIDNYETAYQQKKCQAEGNCPKEDEMDCGSDGECSITEILESLKNDKKSTLEAVLKEQNNADNKDKVFYIDETYSNWTDTLKMDKWETTEQKQGSCTLTNLSAGCPDKDKPGYKVVSTEEIIQNPGANPDPNHNYKSYKVTYVYDEIIEHEGPVGDIYVPIYLNTDEFLKKEKEEVIKLMTEDLEMTQIEAEEQLETYINGSFESSLLTCGFKADYGIFGSNQLIGVGNNGYIGSIDSSQFEQYKGKDWYDPLLNQLVWGEAYKFIDEGKINAWKGHQCTTFVHWMFYKIYGYDCAGGNGNQMAQNLVATNPNFIQSDSPAPGAVASVRLGTQYGHVLFINAVYDDDGDGRWDRLEASDGNLDASPVDTGNDGVRFCHEWTREKWESYWGPTFYAVPVK